LILSKKLKTQNKMRASTR